MDGVPRGLADRGFLSEPSTRRAFQLVSIFLSFGYFLNVVERGEFNFSGDAQDGSAGSRRRCPGVWAQLPAGWASARRDPGPLALHLCLCLRVPRLLPV